MAVGIGFRELRRASVLFFDIAHFSSISEAIGPEGTADFLDLVMRRMAEEIYSREGWVGCYLGDGLMAAFGVPVAHSDDTVRAVDAAVGMRDACRLIREEIERTFRTPFSARIGVNEGEVLAGYIGDEKRKEYTIVGEAVNVARRLQERCPEDEILVSESIYIHTKDFFSYSFFGDLSLKGISRTVKSYKVERGRAFQPPKTRLVGRDREISTIMDLILGEGGGALLIWGESGIGKTRLLDEIERMLVSEGVLVARAICSTTSEFSMAPFRDILRRMIGVRMDEPIGSVRERLRDFLKKMDEEGSDSLMIPLMELISGYREGLADSEGLDIDTLAYGMSSFLERLAKRGRVVIILDDIHVMDKVSRRISCSLIEGRPEGVSLLLSSREPLEWIGNEVVIMEIPPLPKEESRKLFFDMVGDKTFPEELVEELLERSSGNPFLIEGYTTALLENPEMDLSEEIPNPIWKVVMSAVDRLPEDARKLIQISSVLGQRFPMRLLEALPLDFPYEHALVPLLKARLLVEDMVLPERGAAFRNPIIQEVLYSSIPKRERSQLHGVVAKLFEEVFRDRMEELCEVIADHWEKAGDLERAFSFIWRAMDRFLSMPIDDAVRVCEKGVGLLERIGDRKWMMARTLRNLSKAQELAGDLTSARRSLERALNLEVGPEDKAIIMADMARLMEKDAEPLLREAEDLLRSLGLDRSVAMSYVMMVFGDVLLMRGDLRESLRYLEESLHIAKEHGDPQGIIRVSNKLGQAYHRLGDLEKAMRHYEEVMRLGEALDSLPFISTAKNQIGVLLMEVGRGEEAIGFLEEAADGFEKMGERRTLAGVLLNLGYIYSELGDFRKALEFDNRAFEMIRKMGDPYGMALCIGNLGWDHLELGDPEAAYAKAKECIELRERIGFMLDIHDPYHLAARASLMLGRLEEGEEKARKALSLCGDLPREKGRILVTLGRIALRKGKREEAYHILLEAISLLEGFEDMRWIEEAKQGLRDALRE